MNPVDHSNEISWISVNPGKTKAIVTVLVLAILALAVYICVNNTTTSSFVMNHIWIPYIHFASSAIGQNIISAAGAVGALGILIMIGGFIRYLRSPSQTQMHELAEKERENRAILDGHEQLQRDKNGLQTQVNTLTTQLTQVRSERDALQQGQQRSQAPAPSTPSPKTPPQQQSANSDTSISILDDSNDEDSN